MICKFAITMVMSVAAVSVMMGCHTPTRVNDSVAQRIESMNRACNEAYLVSDRVIASNLTPALQSVTETEADLWWDNQVIYDIQAREFVDDWRSFWLLDSPSILNRLPIVDTASP